MNDDTGTVSVIATATNTVLTGTGFPIPVGNAPIGVAVTPDGQYAYIANNGSNSVSVITTASNTVVATVTLPSASGPWVVGIVPPAPGRDYCIDRSGGVVGGTLVARNCQTCQTRVNVWNGKASAQADVPPDDVESGVACASSDGAHVSLGVSTYYLLSDREFDWIRLSFRLKQARVILIIKTLRYNRKFYGSRQAL